MEKRVANIQEGKKSELVWLLEHPPLITAGTSAKSDDLLDKKRFPVFVTNYVQIFTKRIWHEHVFRLLYEIVSGCITK